MDQWGIDCLVTGSERTAAAPWPGPAGSFSARLGKGRRHRHRLFLFQPAQRESKGGAGANPVHPCHQPAGGPGGSLALLLENGLEALYAKQWALTMMARTGVSVMGLELCQKFLLGCHQRTAASGRGRRSCAAPRAGGIRHLHGRRAGPIQGPYGAHRPHGLGGLGRCGGRGSMPSTAAWRKQAASAARATIWNSPWQPTARPQGRTGRAPAARAADPGGSLGNPLGHYTFEMPWRLREQTPAVETQARCLCADKRRNARAITVENTYSQK